MKAGIRVLGLGIGWNLHVFKFLGIGFPRAHTSLGDKIQNKNLNSPD